jgi:hypothetical protein
MTVVYIVHWLDMIFTSTIVPEAIKHFNISETAYILITVIPRFAIGWFIGIHAEKLNKLFWNLND